jgi:RNA polymerase sigma-70 factor, ECF subfamily
MAPAPLHLRLVSPSPSAAEDSRASEGLLALQSLDDAKLVALASKGELSAFETLYRRYAAFAINLAVRIQGSGRDVEDIVHDAFLRAHDRLAELRDRQAFKGWLGAIVVSLIRTRLRKRRLMGAFGLGQNEPVDLDSIAAETASPETRAQLAQVYALLQTMPADDRIAWTLRYVDQHRLEGVAELTGCSLATVKRRISRAQQFLKEYFVPAFAGDPGSQNPSSGGLA